MGDPAPSQTARQAQSSAPLGNNCRTKYMLTYNVEYHDLGADDFTRRKLDVSYGGSPNGQTPSVARSGSTHPTDPQGQADADPHRSLRVRTLQLQQNRKRRPGEHPTPRQLLDNGALRVQIQPQYPLGEAVQAPTTRHTRAIARAAVRSRTARRSRGAPGPGGFVRLPTWLSRR